MILYFFQLSIVLFFLKVENFAEGLKRELDRLEKDFEDIDAQLNRQPSPKVSRSPLSEGKCLLSFILGPTTSTSATKCH